MEDILNLSVEAFNDRELEEYSSMYGRKEEKCSLVF